MKESGGIVPVACSISLERPLKYPVVAVPNTRSVPGTLFLMKFENT